MKCRKCGSSFPKFMITSGVCDGCFATLSIDEMAAFGVLPEGVDATQQLEDHHAERASRMETREAGKTVGGGRRIGLCPFSWIEVTKEPGCLGGLFGGQAKTVSEPQPCMTSRCQLWDSLQNDCGLLRRMA